MCNKFFGFIITIFLLCIFFIPKVFASVVINEFQIEPAGDDQWIELYNTGPSEEDISSWVIDDEGGTEKYSIPSDIALPSGSCISFQSGKFNWNTTTSDKVRLLSGSTIIDEYSYPKSPGNNIVFQRLPDGTGALATSSSITRDKLNSNNSSCLVPPTPTHTTTLTPVPTSTPTHSPTKTPTPNQPMAGTVKKTPTPSPQSKTDRSMAGVLSEDEEVLGVSESAMVNSEPLPLEPDRRQQVIPFVISLLLVAIGFAILSLVLIWKKKQALKLLTPKEP